MRNIQKKVAGNGGPVVAVVGSRGLAACAALLARLAELAPAELVSGGATGADTLGAEWARANGVPLRVLRPDYRTHGPAAPPCAQRRNSGCRRCGACGVGREKPGDAERRPRRRPAGPALRVAGCPGTWCGASAERAGAVRPEPPGPLVAASPAAPSAAGHRWHCWWQLPVATGAALPNKPLDALGQGVRGPAMRPLVRA